MFSYGQLFFHSFFPLIGLCNLFQLITLTKRTQQGWRGDYLRTNQDDRVGVSTEGQIKQDLTGFTRDALETCQVYSDEAGRQPALA